MRKTVLYGLLASSLVLSAAALAQSEPQEITAKPLTDNIYLLSGAGGNVSAFVGDDGTFLIDDKYSGDGPAIQAALESVGGDVPKYLVNTHFHGDHTGSNQHFGAQGSLIVGHRHLHDRLADGYEVKTFNMQVEPAHEHALPELTYTEEMEVHLNGERVRLIHVPDAHTDTDTIVIFTESNVIAAGDTLFNGFFPFIDVPNGGSLAGMIDALMVVMEFTDDDTQIIPGHGPMANRDDLLDTIDKLETAYDRLADLKESGSTLEQAQAAKPLADIEKDWGGAMFTADQWIGLVWPSL